MTFFVLKLAALAGTVQHMDDLARSPFVYSFDPNAHDGAGDVTGTPDPRMAVRFESNMDALMFWRQQSTVRPFRSDGQPNRPLTAFSVEVVCIEEVEA